MLKKVLGAALLVGAAQVSMADQASNPLQVALNICNTTSETFSLGTSHMTNMSGSLISGSLRSNECRSFGEHVVNISQAANMYIDMAGNKGTPELTYSYMDGQETVTPHFQYYPNSTYKSSHDAKTNITTLNIYLKS